MIDDYLIVLIVISSVSGSEIGIQSKH